MATCPIFGTSRSAAGEPIAGRLFKCQLQCVNQALQRGVYEPVEMENWRENLLEVFPDGVCDYSLPGQGFPVDLEGLY